MNGEGVPGNIILVVVILLFMLGSIFLRRRSIEKTELGKVVGLLSEINQNLQIIEDFSFTSRVRKFKTGTWARNQGKLDFLDNGLQTALAKAFGIAEESNQKIDATRRYKSTSYLASIEVEKLKEAMTQSQQELEEWFTENKDKKELFPKKRGLFGQ